MSKPFIASPQQEKVFSWVLSGKGSAIVEAVAGGGKTTTLVEALRHTSGTVSFCAYNKAIVKEIEARVTPLGLGNRVRCGTFHSFGFSAIRRAYGSVRVDVRARRNSVLDSLGLTDDSPTASAIYKTIGLAKQRGFGRLVRFGDTNAWYSLVDHFGLEEELPENGHSITVDQLITQARQGLEYCAANPGLIDFDDMIWLPLANKLRMWQNDWVFVDEAQDTNPARRALAHMMLKSGGRAVFVGDPCQAIYGFTGADSDSLEQIREEFNAIDLPLHVTYRCPKKVVARAQEWVGHITAHESAPEGQVVELMPFGEDGQPWHVGEHTDGRLTRDDAVICRNTKPLVELAFALIRRGIGCHVEGRDIGAGLIALTNKWARIKTPQALQAKLEEWREKQVAKLKAKGQESAVGALEDRVETLFVIMSDPEIKTLDDLRSKIYKIFDDTPEGQTSKNLTLCTIHKSKGREWDRVYWLGREKLQPSKYARKDWELRQEDNLCYVAATRARRELVEVGLELGS